MAEIFDLPARETRNNVVFGYVFIHKFYHSGTIRNMGDQLKLRGILSGHGGWVTAIATTAEDPSMILTASRDKVNILIKLHF